VRSPVILSVVALLTFGIFGAIPVAGGAIGQTQAEGAGLKSVSFQKSEKGLDVGIVIEGEFVQQSFVLENPSRLVVDIAPVRKIETPPYIEVNQFGLTAIRTGQYAASIARAVFDFSGSIPAYEISKTETGIAIRFSAEEKKPEKAVPVEEKPGQPVVAVKEKAPEETAPVEAAAEERPWFKNTSIGFTAGSYQIPSDLFSEVYGSEAKAIYGWNITRTLFEAKGFELDVSLEKRYYSKMGAATVTLDETTFTMNPLTLAGRLLYQAKYIAFYVGFGKDWYNYKEESVLAITEGKANGHSYLAGIYFIMPKAEFIRIKFYYKFTRVQAIQNDVTVDLGGNEYGVGFSLGFNFLNQAVVFF
jgi:hypothetical protein